MPVPHDFYSPYSDEPRLHNRHHSRPYIEPDWQAHAAGHQLPVLSTIGRGPRGYGMHLANYSEDGNSYQFDIISDDPNAEPFTIGPIPTGEIEVATEGGKLVLITNEFYIDGDGERKVKKVRTKVDLPQAEDGTRIFLVKDSDTPRYKTRDDLYQIPWTDLYYYNNQNTQRENAIPEPRVEDLVMFPVYSDEDTMQLEVAYGFFASLDGLDNVLVKAIEYLPTIKGDKGDPGQPGRDGKTPKIRRCLYAIDGSYEQGLASGEVKLITLTYRGDIITGSDAGLDSAYNWLEVDAALPPKTEDILGIVYTEVYINANATMPAITFSPDCGYDFPMGPWGMDLWNATQKKRSNTISVGVFNPYPMPSTSDVEFPEAPIMSAYAVVIAIDIEDEVEPY